jgi:hypothetical protein
MDDTQTKRQNLIYVLLWLVPTWTELAIYLFITFFTIFLCSQDFINSLLFASGDFNPMRAGIASIDGLLTHVVGERVAGSLSLAIFWGTIGLLVNVLWWLGSNFSTELNNDLVFSKYIHPKGSDPQSQLREFIERTAIRTVVAIIGIVYTNFIISQTLPRLTTRYANILKHWDFASKWQSLLLAVVIEILVLHGFVVLTRIILLRKQVFSS